MGNVIKFPVIAGVEINTDQQGRYNLKCLQQAAEAAGVTKDIRPNEWLALQSTQEMVEILITENPAFPPVHSKPGRYGGTFVNELLAVGYAGWISPKFQLQVNQTFIDYKTGNLTPTIPQSLPEALRLAAELAEENEAMKPKAVAFDRLSSAEGDVNVTEAAKLLKVKPKRLFDFLSEQQWIYRRAGGKNWLAYQVKIQAGVLTHKAYTYKKRFQDHVADQVMITPKGLTALSEMFSAEAA